MHLPARIIVPRVEIRGRPIELPELFLGLLAIGIAIVLTAHVFAGTIHDARHSRDTLNVTGSARVPISANLVRWSVTVAGEASAAATAAGILRSISGIRFIAFTERDVVRHQLVQEIITAYDRAER